MKRTLRSLALLAGVFLMPLTSLACGTDGTPLASTSYYQTPSLVKGRLVFVNRVSRRVLKDAVVHLYRPKVRLRAEI